MIPKVKNLYDIIFASSSNVYTKTETDTKINTKQDKLIAGTGIEITSENTINNIQGNYFTKK